jgi:16S rRNA (guanine966-N2)-methyltransferase
MRIVGGRMRGRSLLGPTSAAIRPTSDRLRETIFNILLHSYGDPVEGARVLDLYAGTGAMAIEALSRGASLALLVDKSIEAVSLARRNLESTGLASCAEVLRRDVTRLGMSPLGERFDLAFLDPPYGKGFAGPTLAALAAGRWLEKRALVIVEEKNGVEIDGLDSFTKVETRTYAETEVLFLRAK